MSSQIKSFLLLCLDSDSVQAEPGDGNKFSGPMLVARWGLKSRDATPPATAHPGETATNLLFLEKNHFESPARRDVFYCQFYSWYVVLNLISVHSSVAIEHLLFRLSNYFYFSDSQRRKQNETERVRTRPAPDHFITNPLFCQPFSL